MDQSKFEREVLDRLMRLETKIDMQDYKGIQEKVENAFNKSKTNEERIEKLEDSQKWLIRLVLGAVILGILAFVYKI
ncbi:MAG: hemolysin XhlA family protein [Clostridia bacterium]|nr:hemolysin XhlA family protein [Clostridia bacterium]